MDLPPVSSDSLLGPEPRMIPASSAALLAEVSGSLVQPIPTAGDRQSGPDHLLPPIHFAPGPGSGPGPGPARDSHLDPSDVYEPEEYEEEVSSGYILPLLMQTPSAVGTLAHGPADASLGWAAGNAPGQAYAASHGHAGSSSQNGALLPAGRQGGGLSEPPAAPKPRPPPHGEPSVVSNVQPRPRPGTDAHLNAKPPGSDPSDASETCDPHQFHPHHTVQFVAPPGVISTLPYGCRMFIGNLASEHTSKSELALIFAEYGNIIEISIKDSFGFIQFDNPESCRAAMAGANGRIVGGLSLDLKLSKDKGRRRPPSPLRHHRSDRPEPAPRRPDRERPRDNRPGRERDPHDYPERDRHAGPRGRVYREDSDSELDDRLRYERRDKSPRGGAGRPRRRSASPPRWGSGPRRDLKYDRDVRISLPSEFPLPRRYGPDVPDCQVIVLDEIDRNFIWQLEGLIKNARFKVDTLFLSPKLPLRGVIYQMKAEGVRSVILLERQHERNGLFSMQLFHDNGSFTSHEQIDGPTAVRILQDDRNARQHPRLPGSGANLPNTAAPPAAANLGGVPPSLLASLNIDPQTFSAALNMLQHIQSGTANASALNPSPLGPGAASTNPLGVNPVSAPINPNPLGASLSGASPVGTNPLSQLLGALAPAAGSQGSMQPVVSAPPSGLLQPQPIPLTVPMQPRPYAAPSSNLPPQPVTSGPANPPDLQANIASLLSNPSLKQLLQSASGILGPGAAQDQRGSSGPAAVPVSLGMQQQQQQPQQTQQTQQPSGPGYPGVSLPQQPQLSNPYAPRPPLPGQPGVYVPQPGQQPPVYASAPPVPGQPGFQARPGPPPPQTGFNPPTTHAAAAGLAASAESVGDILERLKQIQNMRTGTPGTVPLLGKPGGDVPLGFQAAQPAQPPLGSSLSPFGSFQAAQAPPPQPLQHSQQQQQPQQPFPQYQPPPPRQQQAGMPGFARPPFNPGSAPHAHGYGGRNPGGPYGRH
ncbi:uncharacterized protein BJ171DRAFT_484450 [Polychytrium aggregatum]|uniref:uncharacterized protein n=1 Tax=Polychytrium aggregatum TaxID=110093 RepID=UPI0022FF283C|nr:uncharacterized protein BJ171DRAFT_484450 [Polychytrium aggregatum]KAI9209572.1 hypothetical protein BJ171DRAFT_484450 [Polychytrium aggregatum]